MLIRTILMACTAALALAAELRAAPAQLPGIVADNVDAELAGEWTASAHTKPFYGANYHHAAGPKEHTATYTLKVPAEGEYHLLVSYCPDGNRSPNAPVTFRPTAGEQTARIDQRQAAKLPSGFHVVGKYRFAAGETKVVISTREASGYVIADAVALLTAEELALAEKGLIAVPDAAAQAEAKELIDEVFKADIDKAKTAALRLGLARKWIEDAAKTNEDAAAQYVLFKEGTLLAANAGDATTVASAVAAMSAVFDIDRDDTHAKLLKLMLTKPLTKPQAAEVGRQAYWLADAALGREDLSAGLEVAQTCAAAARKSGDATAIKLADARVDDVETLIAEKKRIEPALAALEKDPADPAANLAVGRYLCLLKEDWDKGLSMLALGSDPELQKIAEQELKSEGKGSVELAEAWTALARQEKDEGALVLEARGIWHYEQAASTLTGLKRKQVDNLSRSSGRSIRSCSFGASCVTRGACRDYGAATAR